jgi:Rrf2 family protein
MWTNQKQGKAHMAGLVKLSEAANIALHAMILIASEDGGLLATRDIAERLNVSEAHLAKVLQRLTRQGLVQSIRGPKGGFKLARAAKDISLLEVFETIEGPFVPGKCLLGLPVCDGKSCMFGPLLHEVSSKLHDKMARTSLEEVKGTVSMGGR